MVSVVSGIFCMGLICLVVVIFMFLLVIVVVGLRLVCVLVFCCGLCLFFDVVGLFGGRCCGNGMWFGGGGDLCCVI